MTTQPAASRGRSAGETCAALGHPVGRQCAVEPYYSDKWITIYQGKCEETLPTIDDASIDLIVTDPPYFKVKGEWWDRQWDKPETFLAWMGGLCDEWRRILKPNGSIYVFASPQMAWGVEGEVRQRFNVLNSLTWRKPSPTQADHYGGSNAGRVSAEGLRAFYPNSETIIFAEQTSGHDDEYNYNQGKLHADIMKPIRDYMNKEREAAGLSVQDVDRLTGTAMASHWFTHPTQWSLPTREWYEKLQAVFNEHLRREYEHLRREYEHLRREYEELRREYEELRRPFNMTKFREYLDVWDFKTVSAGPGKHPCQKPLSMMEHIIETSSRPGGVVLDCFAGSGVVGRAARNFGRSAVLCEVESKWVRRMVGKFRQSKLFADATQDNIAGTMPAE